MTFPQTEAIRWSTVFSEDDKLKAIAKYGCLAMCYLYCIGIVSEDTIMTMQSLKTAMEKGLLDTECTVLDATKFMEFFAHKKYIVSKKNITSIANIKDKTPVRYEYNGSGHWVVVENGKIVFNSLANSICVAKGKPTSARVIYYE